MIRHLILKGIRLSHLLKAYHAQPRVKAAPPPCFDHDEEPLPKIVDLYHVVFHILITVRTRSFSLVLPHKMYGRCFSNST